MGMAKTLPDLRATPVDELVSLHDNRAEHTMAGVDYYLNEIHRRESEAISRSIQHYTRWMSLMTVIITVATTLNLLLFVLRG